jgi:hypothetical protein
MNVGPSDPTPGSFQNQPLGPTPPQQSFSSAQANTPSAGSMSALAAFLGPQGFKMFIGIFSQMINSSIQKDSQKMHEAAQDLKKSLEDDDD